MPLNVLHSIEVDRARKLVDLRVRGLVTPEDAAWIGEELRAAVRSLGEDVGKHVSLYDASAVQVVPQETVDHVIHSFQNPAVLPLRARKIAFVVGSALGRMQAQRIREVLPEMQVFDDRETALAWLLAEGD